MTADYAELEAQELDLVRQIDNLHADEMAVHRARIEREHELWTLYGKRVSMQRREEQRKLRENMQNELDRVHELKDIPTYGECLRAIQIVLAKTEPYFYVLRDLAARKLLPKGAIIGYAPLTGLKQDPALTNGVDDSGFPPYSIPIDPQIDDADLTDAEKAELLGLERLEEDVSEEEEEDVLPDKPATYTETHFYDEMLEYEKQWEEQIYNQ